MAVRAGCDLIGARRRWSRHRRVRPSRMARGIATRRQEAGAWLPSRTLWSRLGTLERVGVEGPGSFGAGLTRWLRARGVVVLEVSRPNRQLRRHAGKSDQIDAEAAARAVQAGAALGRPKTTDGQVEMLRALRVA